MERKVAKRQEWAATRRTAAERVMAEGDKYRNDWAFNTQPGHIPERARLNARQDRALQSLEVATHHETKAAGLADQLERAIFDDDPDAIAQLEARIAEREIEAAREVAINKAWRKAKGNAAALVTAGLIDEATAQRLVKTMALFPGLRSPLNPAPTRAAIRRDQARIAAIKVRRARSDAAATASAGVVIEGKTWIRVTFAEKPDRDILDALNAAGFRWARGSWCGERAHLPAGVAAAAGLPAAVPAPAPDAGVIPALPTSDAGLVEKIAQQMMAGYGVARVFEGAKDPVEAVRILAHDGGVPFLAEADGPLGIMRALEVRMGRPNTTPRPLTLVAATRGPDGSPTVRYWTFQIQPTGGVQ